jgi:hypothetical protein
MYCDNGKGILAIMADARFRCVDFELWLLNGPGFESWNQVPPCSDFRPSGLFPFPLVVL